MSLNCVSTLLISYTILVIIAITHLTLVSMKSYMEERNKLLKIDEESYAGGITNLTTKETAANEVILKLKNSELVEAYKDPSKFLPAQNFIKVKEKIQMESEVFKVIKTFPKGASLHTHMLAGVSVDYIINNFTYRDHLYGCFINETFKLRFFQDDNHTDARGNWKTVKQLRNENPNFDGWLKEQLTLEKEVVEKLHDFSTVDKIWSNFKKIFNTGYEMFSYRPVFEESLYQLFKELYLDNVMYTELRGTFMPLYELNGTTYAPKKFLEIFQSVVVRFKQDFPDFIGARYIHSVYRGVDKEVLQKSMDEFLAMQQLFPDVIAGFDFVGFEEEGHNLFYYSEVLLEAKKETEFFFHAGETAWFGYTDLNLLDAILLGSKRIGHGYALIKHPKFLEVAKQKDIVLEVSPISNQILMMHEDLRSHPAVSLLAMDYPVVICNDDPSIWKAEGLSYDWYVTFMAMTPKGCGIGILKKLAKDSIKYSCMTEKEKQRAYELWEEKYQLFMNEIIE